MQREGLDKVYSVGYGRKGKGRGERKRTRGRGEKKW